eukprot:4916289-Heterocapsa_arctica.AAC.1
MQVERRFASGQWSHTCRPCQHTMYMRARRFGSFAVRVLGAGLSARSHSVVVVSFCLRCPVFGVGAVSVRV